MSRRILSRRSFLKLSSALAAAPHLGAFAELPPGERLEASHDAMGTVFDIVAYGRDRQSLARACNAAFDEIDRLDRQMSNYKADSELSRINRDAAREAVEVEPRLFDLIAESLRTSEASGGAFDITVGPLMRSWGFFRGEGRVPPRGDLDRVMKRAGYRHVHLDRERRTVRFDVGGIELDLGGIAKGYAVDRAVEMLKAGGAEAALVSSGASSIVALGAPPGERAWRIHLRDPHDRKKKGDVVMLKNYSLGVSGSFEKFFTVAGKTYCHILDPRTGRPVEGMLMTAVLAPHGVESDANSTAMFVLGAQKSRDYLKSNSGLAALVYEPAPGERRYRRTRFDSPGFAPPAESVAVFEMRADSERICNLRRHPEPIRALA